MLNTERTIIPLMEQDKPGNRISFVLFGGVNNQYSLGAFYNVVLCDKIYPGWIPRIYVDKEDHRCNFFEEMNAEVFLIKDKNPPMFWRMYAIDDPKVKYVVFRDVDSLLTKREAIAVEEWIQSGKMFHRMKEAIHKKHLVILAGMWGIHAPSWRKKHGRIRTAINRFKYGNYNVKTDNQTVPYNLRPKLDERFLNEFMWPKVKDDCMFHGFSDKHGQAKPFKVPYDAKNKYKKEYCDFVGSRVYNFRWK